MAMLLGRRCRCALSRLLFPDGSADVVWIAAGQAECSKRYERLDHRMGSPSPMHSHGHLLASLVQPYLGTASRVEPPLFICVIKAKSKLARLLSTRY